MFEAWYWHEKYRPIAALLIVVRQWLILTLKDCHRKNHNFGHTSSVCTPLLTISLFDEYIRLFIKNYGWASIKWACSMWQSVFTLYSLKEVQYFFYIQYSNIAVLIFMYNTAILFLITSIPSSFRAPAPVSGSFLLNGQQGSYFVAQMMTEVSVMMASDRIRWNNGWPLFTCLCSK